jgi:hypothetical protein
MVRVIAVISLRAIRPDATDSCGAVREPAASGVGAFKIRPDPLDSVRNGRDERVVRRTDSNQGASGASDRGSIPPHPML